MNIVIIGAGPAGLMCAIKAGENIDNKITIIDSNEKVGKKLFITGKGRCNVCNYCSNTEFLNNVVTNSKFLFGAINKFSSQDLYNFFENSNVKLKVERGQRVFPVSDKSSDIIKGLLNKVNKKNTTILLSTKIKSIQKNNNQFILKTSSNNTISCDKLVIATGGKSYSSTGSTGDGYKFAQCLGHSIISPKPALVPILLKNYNGELAGLTLKNVSAKINLEGKTFEQFGELLFTHEGLSGPIILTLSSFINKYQIENKNIIIDLKPALTDKVLDDRLLRDFASTNKILKNYFKELMPNSLVDYFIKVGNFDENKKTNLVTKEERKKIIFLLKNLSFTIKSLDSIDHGIITSGGVDVKQINPKNMESKICKNLFFAGEVIDVDALTGGFNIQIAMSTGFCVGDYLSKKEDF